MAITYYPNETDKKAMNVIEKLQQPNMLYSVFGVQDLSAGALSASVWCPKGWEVKRVSLHYTSASAKSYAVSIVKGIGVSSGKNDRLWVGATGSCIQQVIIPQGFYDGTSLPIAIAAALNSASLKFASAAKPFTSGYTASTGLTTIAPAAGTAYLLTTNTATRVRDTSTFAPLIGFTANAAAAATITSNVPVLGVSDHRPSLSKISIKARRGINCFSFCSCECNHSF